MYLQRLLQINVATLAALGSLLLGMGQRGAGLPLLVMIAAITSIGLTDVTGWFRLNRTVANVAAVAAVVVCLRQVRYYGGDVQILGTAPLLVYLQIILLFQEKNTRVYWQLIVLSLLQVVVAAAFSQGVWFGVLLVVYMLVGLSALALFFFYRQWSHYRAAVDSPPTATAAERRWPLARQQPHFASVPSGRGRAGVCGELFGRLAGIGLGTLGLTSLLFFTVPRFGRPAWRGAAAAPQHVVGFSEKVTLGEMGEIIESREEVMRVWFTTREAGETPYTVRGDLYLRGAVLTDYRRGQWEDRAGGTRGERPLPQSAVESKERLVRQRITIMPMSFGQDQLFCVWPFVEINPDDRLRFRRGRLVRRSRYCRRQFTFTLGTTAFVDGVQTPLVPCDQPVDLKQLLQLPEVPELEKLAAQWMAERRPPAEDRIAQARALEQLFRDPKNQFQYTLEGQIRNLDVDPIEDFIRNNRRGHCEYFATALALMLRSRGIPSRVVVGFKCDEFHDLDNFYRVRQLHAHAWVEAYLQPRHIPRQLLLGDRPSRWAGGGWLRLEPTPAASDASWAGAAGTLLGRMEQAVDWLESFWADYVMEMDRQRQQKAIYEPLVRLARNVIRRLRNPDWWRGVIAEIGKALNAGRWGGFYRLGIPLIVLVALLWLGGRWIRRRWRRLWDRLAGRAAAAAGSSGAEVEFYRRLEALLARHGLRRSAGQTQHEFATAAGARIAAVTGRPQLASLPAKVVEAFYQVRFGHLPLDSPRTQAVEQALAQLAACGLAGPAEIALNAAGRYP